MKKRLSLSLTERLLAAFFAAAEPAAPARAMMPRISSSRMIRSSSPSSLISEPLYLPNKHAVADLTSKCLARAVVSVFAFADGDHFALLRFLFRGVGDDDPATHLLALFYPPHDHAIM